MLTKLVKFIQKKKTGQFTRNIGWLGMAELSVRVFRLGTTVVLSRMFTPYDYGSVAIIYTIFGFAEVFTMGTVSGGLSAKIVEANEDDLEDICNTTYWISWIMCISLTVIQCALAYPIASFYDDLDLIWPIRALSLMYLMYPTYKVLSGLIQRENRLKILALCRATQAILVNLMTITFALMGWGVWSVVLAMVLATPSWIFITYYYQSWRPPKKISMRKWKDVAVFGGNMMGVTLMDKLRLNIDYLIIGRVLGVDVLGLYFFAFSAGLGISKNVINSTVTALLPHLCSFRDNFQTLRKEYLKSLKTTALLIAGLVLLQSTLAPFYVPIIFGEKWTPAIPVLITICLSAIPLAISMAGYQLLISVGKIQLTLVWNVIYTLIFGLSILGIVYGSGDIFHVALVVLGCQSLGLLFTAWGYRHVFKYPS